MNEPQAIATGKGRGIDVAAAAAAAATAAAIAWSYYPNLRYLAGWWEDPNYSHGWLIAPIALFILWQRRELMPPAAEVRHRWWDFLPLALLLAWRYHLYGVNEQYTEAATFPLVVAAATLAVGGWRTVRWAWPGLVFLIFMVPLPPRLDGALSAPLQRVATNGAYTVLTVLNQAAVMEGNVILIGSQRVEVAEACRGLAMLLSFGALITAMVILNRRLMILERAALIASIIPIALVCNIIRISVTAIAYKYFDRPVHEVHDYAGFAMMGLALALVLGELSLMSWLVVEERPRGPRPAPPGPLGPNPGPR